MVRLKTRRKPVHQHKETARANPYRSDVKPQGQVQCVICHAVSIQGRWVPCSRFRGEGKTQCPACRQHKDRFAMGVVELHGEKWKEKTEQVLKTIQSSERVARHRNDQERILWTQQTRGITKIYVSLPELARHLGRELGKTFKGKVQYVRSTEEPYLRVKWMSDFPNPRLKARPLKAPHKSRAFRGRATK